MVNYKSVGYRPDEKLVRQPMDPVTRASNLHLPVPMHPASGPFPTTAFGVNLGPISDPVEDGLRFVGYASVVALDIRQGLSLNPSALSVMLWRKACSSAAPAFTLPLITHD